MNEDGHILSLLNTAMMLRDACSIPDPDSDTLIVTGGEHTLSTVSRCGVVTRATVHCTRVQVREEVLDPEPGPPHRGATAPRVRELRCQRTKGAVSTTKD